ncbi:MAG: phosphoribosylglycinamide formyltransferase [Pirellulaceae bacterium]|nr:phosphoribosylglycinamide formyltransferase [Pirellulaceae bacterium]
MNLSISGQSNRPLRLGVLISGGGTTLKNLIDKSAAGEINVEFAVVISSNSDAAGLRFARDAGIEWQAIEQRKSISTQAYSDCIFNIARDRQVDLVVMAGFLKHVLIPSDFENRVMNIHPSLIPAYCGRGYYGHHVHEAVLKANEKITGCTVHFVDNEYDHGPIILQRQVEVQSQDTTETLAARVFSTECEAYPTAIRMYAAGQLDSQMRG